MSAPQEDPVVTTKKRATKRPSLLEQMNLNSIIGDLNERLTRQTSRGPSTPEVPPPTKKIRLNTKATNEANGSKSTRGRKKSLKPGSSDGSALEPSALDEPLKSEEEVQAPSSNDNTDDAKKNEKHEENVKDETNDEGCKDINAEGKNNKAESNDIKADSNDNKAEINDNKVGINDDKVESIDNEAESKDNGGDSKNNENVSCEQLKEGSGTEVINDIKGTETEIKVTETKASTEPEDTPSLPTPSDTPPAPPTAAGE